MGPDPLSSHSSELPDEELMQRLRDGDRAALAELMERHQARLLARAYRFLARGDAAEDVAQEAFLRVFRAAPQWRPEARFTTWLYRLTANLWWARRRQAARRQRGVAQVRPPDDAAPSEPDLERRERAARVQAAVAALPDRQRLAVVLHRYQGLSHREIAEVTGWSTSAVESCLVRAYEQLRKALSDMQLE